MQALLDVEAALVRAAAAQRQIPSDAAERIAAACRAERFDAAALARGGADHATVVVPLVECLRAAVGPSDAPFVHAGATSQDIIDTAAMVIARRALDLIIGDVDAVIATIRRLTVTHRKTPMVGRTLLQQAAPTTFGLRAAGWMCGIAEARDLLAGVRAGGLPVQLGGVVGRRPPEIADAVAAMLDLTAPPLPWQAVRIPVGRLAGALGTVAGALGKVARDVTLHAQAEVGELREEGPQRGRSSAMAHKRNPVAAISVLACSRQVPGVVATLLAAMEQEYERAAGAWQAEWKPFIDLLTLTGSAAAWTQDLFDHLVVDPDRMWANLERFARDAGRPVEADDVAGADRLIDRALAAVSGERGAAR